MLTAYYEQVLQYREAFNEVAFKFNSTNGLARRRWTHRLMNILIIFCYVVVEIILTLKYFKLKSFY